MTVGVGYGSSNLPACRANGTIGKVRPMSDSADPPAPQTLWHYAFAAAQVLSVALFISFAVMMHGWMFADPGEMTEAGDFTSFYAASDLSLHGRAADTYSEPPHYTAQKALFRNLDRGYLTFMYPPIFLLLCLPFALLPFVVMTAVWLVATAAAYVAAIFAVLPRPSHAVLFLCYPAVFVNAGYGQNGALSAALLGFAAWSLDRRPMLAGMCFGLLSYKPHLGLLVPLTLLITGRWRAFITATLTVLVLAGVTTLVFGPEIWAAYTGRADDARRWLESDDVNYLDKWISLYGAIRLHGGSLPLAYGAQAVLGVLAGGAFFLTLWRRRAGYGYRGRGDAQVAALTATIPFCTPFLLEYDLLILAVPMAWLVGEGVRTGFRRGEIFALVFAFAMPALFKITIWNNGFKLLVTASSLALLVVVLRRIWVSEPGAR